MTSRDAVRTALARAVEIGAAREVQGLRRHEIEGLEAALQAPLPDSYRAFCELAGWHPGLLLPSFWFPMVLDGRAHLQRQADDDPELAGALARGS